AIQAPIIVTFHAPQDPRYQFKAFYERTVQAAAAKDAKAEDKGAGFYGYRRHDVCSFIKLSYKYLFSRHHSRKNVVITTTFS
ncbi:hypothetical protein, partial [Klebsiella pneumoniae]|uniref:hypothetical protein n=1 Tax=Klebsiella pneumoniae TaxID=573 RepID=UPI002730F4C5